MRAHDLKEIRSTETSKTYAARVLIVRIGAMGDVLHAMPAVAALRASHPDWFIGWAIDPRWNELLQIAGDPDDLSLPAAALLDRWYRVPTKAWRRRPLAPGTVGEIRSLGRALRGERFDVCVDMQGALKSAAVGRMARAKVYAGMARPREAMAAWMYGRKIELRSRHVVEQGCELLGAAVGKVLRPAKVSLPMNSLDELWVQEIVGGLAGKGRFVLISPDAGWGAKVWPPERYGAVAAALGRAGFAVLVNAASAEDRIAEGVVRASEGAARAVVSTVGQLISLVRRAAVVIAGDTGPLHLAAALERPVVALFGPTDPARNGPWGTSGTVLRHPESVTSHRRTTSPDEGLLQIRVDEVVDAALQALSRTAPEAGA